MKNIILTGAVLAISLLSCSDDATVAKANLAKAADNFELNRRIMFINTWTDTHLMIIEGRCNVEYGNARTSVICKTGKDNFKRSFIGNSGQVTAMVEQLDGIPVNVYHYRRTFNPQSIIPDIDFRGSAGDLKDSVTPDNND